MLALNGKISIALCTHNGERFLSDQFESYLNQTRLPDELIVCDDGSSDQTLAILGSFAANAPFTVNIHQNHKTLGVVKNFEKAISLCTGDLIFLSDQDDVWEPRKIARTVEEFDTYQETGLVFTNAVLVDERLQPLGVNLWDINFSGDAQRRAQSGGMIEAILNHDVVTGATVAFRATYKSAIGPIPDRLTNVIHDKWIALAIASRNEIRGLPECLTLYRQHSGQQIGASIPKNSDSKHKPPLLRSDLLRSGIKYNEERLRAMETLSAELTSFFSAEHSNSDRSLPVMQAIASEICDAERALLHFKNRSLIPHRSRVPIIVRELLSGRYKNYSTGIYSAAKDLFTR